MRGSTIISMTTLLSASSACVSALNLPLLEGTVNKSLYLSAINYSGDDPPSSSGGFGAAPAPKKRTNRKRKRALKTPFEPQQSQPIENLTLAPSRGPAVSSEAPQLTSFESSLYQSACSENEEKTTLCSRISSVGAAALIKSRYECKTRDLLVITSDASGGSGRFHGLCAVLRHIHNSQDSLSIATRRTRVVHQCTGKRKSRTRRASRARKIGAGRVLGMPAELSAVSLGLRAALEEISAEDGCNILLLIDCERTIAYLCDGLYEEGDPINRALQSLLGETESNFIRVASVASVSKLRFDGFFDHALADYIAGLVRGRPNPDADVLIHEDMKQLECKRLHDTDLEWLG
eukprot:CAMPEP_0197724802 /NCGR_PEP_ID=MMETSP1434-20131217/6575_1 /TAXON_ID=265543 /ORGANISM="Minutocellus polymorphus, Strain CCMP3303" /LENGTH=347 /DNA_ID=CAMNT_0043310199 /DNA_START=1 /DNA_END=1041 /DNA_ORIENTATION=+